MSRGSGHGRTARQWLWAALYFAGAGATWGFTGKWFPAPACDDPRPEGMSAVEFQAASAAARKCRADDEGRAAGRVIATVAWPVALPALAAYREASKP